ncbi:hypothetical protein AM420_002871 [Klebsiella pneumoniae]|nr:hypothetical protein AM420_002871 [Klebsiella pneumoniae]CAE7379802.1 hypothetical protein AI2660V1_1750 [Klebsiella pneumoniae]CAH3709321.1 hypothetical protein AI2660V1_1750 [Klebsiella pneumoniae]SWL02607.1 Uncharacterised protein [Klebsiella pneumoniae]
MMWKLSAISTSDLWIPKGHSNFFNKIRFRNSILGKKYYYIVIINLVFDG